MRTKRVLPSESRKSGCAKSNPCTSMMPISTPLPLRCFCADPKRRSDGAGAPTLSDEMIGVGAASGSPSSMNVTSSRLAIFSICERGTVAVTRFVLRASSPGSLLVASAVSVVSMKTLAITSSDTSFSFPRLIPGGSSFLFTGTASTPRTCSISLSKDFLVTAIEALCSLRTALTTVLPLAIMRSLGWTLRDCSPKIGSLFFAILPFFRPAINCLICPDARVGPIHTSRKSESEEFNMRYSTHCNGRPSAEVVDSLSCVTHSSGAPASFPMHRSFALWKARRLRAGLVILA